MFAEIWSILRHVKFVDVLDILLVAAVVYFVLLLIKESRAYQLAWGMAFIAALFFLTRWGRLSVSNRLFESFLSYLIIGGIILFQGEIRRFLAGIGSRSIRTPLRLRSFQEKLDDVCLALDYLAQKKIGALIAIEREITLAPYVDRGVKLDAILTKDLLVSIFFPHAPLHDGAVIIQGDKLVAAGCLLPLPATHSLSPLFQTRTRHLAALGLSQETDAAVIVVSEESGDVSLVARGRLEKLSNRDDLRGRLLDYLKGQ